MYRRVVLTSKATTTPCEYSSHSPHTGEHSPVWALIEKPWEQLVATVVLLSNTEVDTLTAATPCMHAC